jgi:hypothetical protein
MRGKKESKEEIRERERERELDGEKKRKKIGEPKSSREILACNNIQ